MYSEKVMDHFNNPRNVGEIDNASGVGTVGNAKCGDIMRMYIKVKDNVITDVKERGQILVNDQNVTNAYLMHEGDLLEVVFPPTHQGENIISIKVDFIPHFGV